jgi:hypothetical protein
MILKYFAPNLCTKRRCIRLGGSGSGGLSVGVVLGGGIIKQVLESLEICSRAVL